MTSYNFTPIDDPQAGRGGTIALGLNNPGQVVGYTSIAPEPNGFRLGGGLTPASLIVPARQRLHGGSTIGLIVSTMPGQCRILFNGGGTVLRRERQFHRRPTSARRPDCRLFHRLVWQLAGFYNTTASTPNSAAVAATATAAAPSGRHQQQPSRRVLLRCLRTRPRLLFSGGTYDGRRSARRKEPCQRYQRQPDPRLLP